jgi:hypothetical protein
MMLQVLVSQLDAPAPSQDGGMLGYKLVPRPLSLDAVPRSAAAWPCWGPDKRFRTHSCGAHHYPVNRMIG